MAKLKCVLFCGIAACATFVFYALSRQKLWSNQILNVMKKDDYRETWANAGLIDGRATAPLHEMGSSAALDYCNFPSSSDVEEAEEGKPADSSWILKQVQILIRHGDRSPIGNGLYKKLKVTPTYCKLNPDKEPTHPSLRDFMKGMAEDFAKLKTRKINFFASPYPNKAVCGSATLSQLGVVQHIHQGQLLQKRYVEDHGLLSGAGANITSKVSVLSTPRSRTIQSAVAFLFGFVPEFHLTQVRIKYHRSDLFNSMSCPAAGAMQESINDVRYKSYLQRQKTNSTFRKLSELFNFNDHSGPLIDGFVTGFLCKNMELPCVNSNCTTVDDLNVLLEEETYMTRAISEQSPYVNQSMLHMHPLLTEIDRMMFEKATDDGSAPDFVLYSGHDTTVKPLIRTLGIPDYRWPRLGTRLVFELWYSPAEQRHYIRILLNGRDHTVNTRCCQLENGSKHAGPNTCSYDSFHKCVEEMMKNHFGVASLKKACEL